MSIEEINKNIQKQILTSSGINFISLLKYRGDKKLSITAVYDELDYKFIDINNNMINFDSFYYGLHPSFTDKAIRHIIIERLFKNPNDLEKYVTENPNLFHMYKHQNKYIKSIYKKVILQSLSKFGIKCEVKDKNDFDKIVNCLKNQNHRTIKYTSFNEPIFLLGSITDETIESFAEIGLFFHQSNNEIFISSNKGNYFNFSSDILEQNFKLCYGQTYYSGVMLKLMRINEIPTSFSNVDTDSLVLNVHRTTFFTEDAFDNHLQNNNNLLNDENKKLIIEFFELEDKKQLKVIKSNPNISLELINEYLKNSSFTNIIGITANLKTLDDKFIISERGEKVVDAGMMYPSANGHAEFNDNYVSFYRESSYEDIPTIMANNNRIVFNDEMEREVSAELNVDDFKYKWNYLGLSVIGIIPKLDMEVRRFHFNVLFENTVNHNGTEIIELQKDALEKYENKNLYLISLNIYKNFFVRILSFIMNCINLAVKNKNLVRIFALSIIILQTLSFLEINDKLKELFFNTGVDIILLIFSSIIMIKTVYSSLSYLCKYRKNLNKINHIKIKDKIRNNNKIVDKTIKKISKRVKKNIEFQPIGLLMYHIYIDKIVKKQYKKGK